MLYDFNPHEARSSWPQHRPQLPQQSAILIHTKREARGLVAIRDVLFVVILIHTKREARGADKYGIVESLNEF